MQRWWNFSTEFAEKIVNRVVGEHIEVPQYGFCDVAPHTGIDVETMRLSHHNPLYLAVRLL